MTSQNSAQALIRYINFLLIDPSPDHDALTRTRDQAFTLAVSSSAGAGRTALYEAWMAICASLKGCTPVELPIKPGQMATIIDCNEAGKTGVVIRPHLLGGTVIGYTVAIDGDLRHFYEFMVSANPLSQPDMYRLQVWFSPDEFAGSAVKVLRPSARQLRVAADELAHYQPPF